jgi:hypothetical protein
MFDSKLIQGLLIAACVFLALGILTTALEIQDYKGVEASAGAAPSRTPTSEEDADDEPEAEPAAEEDTAGQNTDETEGTGDTE